MQIIINDISWTFVHSPEKFINPYYKYNYIYKPTRFLGATNIAQKTFYVDKNMDNDKFISVMAHELGHMVLASCDLIALALNESYTIKFVNENKRMLLKMAKEIMENEDSDHIYYCCSFRLCD